MTRQEAIAKGMTGQLVLVDSHGEKFSKYDFQYNPDTWEYRVYRHVDEDVTPSVEGNVLRDLLFFVLDIKESNGEFNPFK